MYWRKHTTRDNALEMVGRHGETKREKLVGRKLKTVHSNEPFHDWVHHRGYGDCERNETRQGSGC
jgi:hypothetical protein